MRTAIAIAIVALVVTISSGCREEATSGSSESTQSPSATASSPTVAADDDTFEALAGRWEHQSEDGQGSSYLDIEANGSSTFTPHQEDLAYTGVLALEEEIHHFNLDLVSDDGAEEMNMDIWLSANGEVLTAAIDQDPEIGFSRSDT